MIPDAGREDGHAIAMLRAIGRSANAMNATLDPEELLDIILDQVAETFSISNCAILLLDERSRRLVVRKSRGYAAEAIAKYDGKLGIGISGSVASSGVAERVGDVTLDPRYIPGTGRGRSEMAVPLRSGDGVIGVIDAESPEKDAFDGDDLEFFSIFASQAATAIRNAVVHESSRRYGAKIASINEIGTSLNTIKDRTRLLREIILIAQKALGFSCGSVLLLDDARERLVVVESYGFDRNMNGFSIPVGEGVTGFVAETRSAALVRDVRADPRYIETRNEIVSEMACPLMVHGELIGVLDVESATDPFDDEDLLLFSSFAAQVSTALFGAKLVSQLEAKNKELIFVNLELKNFTEKLSIANHALERRVRDLQTLYEAGKTITSSLNLEETLHAIIRMTNEIVSISSGAIMLIDEETLELKEKVSYQNSDMERGSNEKRFDIPLTIKDKVIGSFSFSHCITDTISEEDSRLLQTLASQASIAIENAKLFEDTQNAYYDTISSLAQALETRDPYTKGHSERVTEYSLGLARALGFEEKRMAIIRYAGLLHDIGKIGIPDELLHKSRTLDPGDFERIKEHSKFGNTILGPLRFLQEAQLVVMHHHERWDGTGYPDKLAGRDIPELARIIGIADAFDAMTSDRPYRPAMTVVQALEQIASGAGTQFDPEFSSAFIALVRTAPGPFTRS